MSKIAKLETAQITAGETFVPVPPEGLAVGIFSIQSTGRSLYHFTNYVETHGGIDLLEMPPRDDILRYFVYEDVPEPPAPYREKYKRGRLTG